MFERFTDRARRALVVAQERAKEFGHGGITPDHILLALTEEGSGIAARAMLEAGVDTTRLRERVAASSQSHAPSREADRLPFTPQAKKILELSLREALALGDNYIGTEHILLGILRADDDVETLLAVPIAGLRNQVLALKSAAGAPPALSPALGAAMDRGRKVAGPAPMTSGHLLEAMLDDDGSQAATVLRGLGVTKDAVRDALTSVPVEGTSDEEPVVQPIELKVGDTSIKVTDKTLVARLRSATPGEILKALGSYFHGRVDRVCDEGDPGRLSDRARLVLELAKTEARQFDHDFIGTEHILLGLIHEGEGIAAQVLESLGISLTAVRAKVETTVGAGRTEPGGSPPFTPRAKKVLELSLREALQLGHGRVGTEHLLLGLVREGHGVAAQVLVSLGADLDRTREAVLRVIGEHTD